MRERTVVTLRSGAATSDGSGGVALTAPPVDRLDPTPVRPQAALPLSAAGGQLARASGGMNGITEGRGAVGGSAGRRLGPASGLYVQAPAPAWAPPVACGRRLDRQGERRAQSAGRADT